MATMALPYSSLFSLALVLLFLPHKTTGAQICETTYCGSGGIPIEFPFWLKEASQSRRCGYPGFELSCSNSGQPVLSLPNSGDFLVTSVSLEYQQVWIEDPDNCLPRRILQGFSLKGSPFRLSDGYNPVNYTFFNCSSNLTISYPALPISCLTSNNHTVLAVLSDYPFDPTPQWTSSCQLISSALVPVAEPGPWAFWTDYDGDIQLQWNYPNCGNCEASGGRCGFLDDNNDLLVGCHNLPSQGLSRKAKYGISIGLGLPGLLGIIGLYCFRRRKRNTPEERQRQANTQVSSLIIPSSPVVVMGLDGAAIEKYPKTQLGESGRLPKPNDNICSICLCEYQPKDTLRTIPECNHYFHANCIDGWLKMNATCPLCRKPPERSSFVPSLPMSPNYT